MTQLKVFQKWLLENEALVVDLNIKVKQGGEREVISKHSIKSNKNIVSIPKKLIITELHGMDTEFGKLLLNGDHSQMGNLGISLVAIYILTTFNKDCFFQPYYDILPDNLQNFPIFWNKTELSHLQGSNILNKITERVNSFINDYNIIAMNCPGFKEQHPLKHFFYIRTLIGSRNFGINIDGEKRVAMVPFADMLNHHESPDTRWYYCPNIQGFKMDSVDKIASGCEVTDTYGKKCNSKLLIFYGFAMSDNDENTVHIELTHCKDDLKVLKSDIGKAALLYAGGTYLGGTAMFGGSGAGFSNFGSRLMSPMGGNSFGSLFSNSRNAKNAGKGIFGRAKGLKDKYDDMGTFGRMATMGGIGLGLSMIPGLNKAKPNETNFSDRGGPLLNSQGDGSQGSISREIQEAYASGDSQRIMELQKYYNYMLPSQDAVQDLSLPSSLPYPNYAEGGRIGKAEGGLLNMGGMEKDYRNDGGFVPIGEYEKKDDVPARLSVNEFVFTADAVRNAGEGDIDKGAEVMENMMKNLENGGTVSEESQGNQGNTGAQDMFSVSQRLGEVI